MGPVPVMSYIAVRCVMISEEDLDKYHILVSTLRMGEILFESLPQLLLNAVSLVLRCNNSGPGKFYANVSIFKWLSGFDLSAYSLA